MSPARMSQYLKDSLVKASLSHMSDVAVVRNRLCSEALAQVVLSDDEPSDEEMAAADATVERIMLMSEAEIMRDFEIYCAKKNIDAVEEIKRIRIGLERTLAMAMRVGHLLQ